MRWPKDIKVEYDSYRNLYEKSHSLTAKFVKLFESADCKSCKAKNTKFDFKPSRCISSCKNKESIGKICVSIAKIDKEIEDKRKNLAMMIYDFCVKKKVKLKKYNTKDVYSFNEIINNPKEYGQITKLIELVDSSGIYVIK